MSESPIEKMIRAAVSCTKCGTKGFGNCGCWEKCSCGWTKEVGGKCNNPDHGEGKAKLGVNHYGKGKLP